MKELISKNKFLRKPSESRTTCSPAKRKVNRDVFRLESGIKVSFNTVHFIQQIIYRTIKGVRGHMFVYNRKRDYSINQSVHVAVVYLSGHDRLS